MLNAPMEAWAFFLASTEGLIGPQQLLAETETAIRACATCSETFVYAQPRHSQFVALTILGIVKPSWYKPS